MDDPSDPNICDAPTVRDILNNLRAMMPMLSASSLPPLKMCTQLSIQLMPMSSVPPPCRLQGQQDPLGLMRMNGNACAPLVHASIDLCNSLALVAKRLCTSYVDPRCVSPLLACHLLALDKNLIDIGDNARRIIYIARLDVQNISGCLQLCSGQISGIEAAVHCTDCHRIG